MKKILFFFTTIGMCVTLVACGNQMEKESKNKEYVGIDSELQGNENMITENNSDTELQEIELVGLWHINQEKTDISVIEAEYDAFPGYVEWGDSMEIRSDGQMNWYIGAAGGTGNYIIDGDVLHAKLTDSLNQKEVNMDFRIVGKDEIIMTYDNMEITWGYGDKENILVNDK